MLQYLQFLIVNNIFEYEIYIYANKIYKIMLNKKEYFKFTFYIIQKILTIFILLTYNVSKIKN